MVPVILLAFANDKQNSGAGYLRGLTLERNGIRDALRKAEENGLCQVLVEPDVTVDRLFDIFQNSAYRDRIALFHYGGHAESYSLLLESASGGKMTAHSEGLVGFLAKQKSLKLIFLNGCSSQKQSEDLVSEGLPAVIGTSQSINDTIATGLSNRFYKGIAAGMTIERAWTDAVDQIKTETGKDNTQALYTEGILGAPMEDTFPWKLFIGEGGELSKAWNLPEAANQPLFGLELPVAYYRKLPKVPYIGLRSFTREEASIFFGRGQDIRKLYTQCVRQEPVILLSGKKGVGKTSMLKAGLLPRLESSSETTYFAIQQHNPDDSLNSALNQLRNELGMDPVTPKDKSDLLLKIKNVENSLSTTTGFAQEILEEELGRLKTIAARDHQGLHEQWLAIEAHAGKPLIVVLDEMPLRPSAWTELVEVINGIFEIQPAPKGKLILSIDEESHAAFSEALQAVQVPFVDVFLQPLSWEGVQEAITGITKSPITSEFYRLRIEMDNSDNLPLAMVGDLMDGDHTLIAPYLQLILSSLWEMAVAENAQSPEFNLRTYQKAIVSGDIMDDFLTNQMSSLKSLNAAPVESGLALDLLYLHTSALGKSRFLDPAIVDQTYKDRQGLVDQLIEQCRSLWLLTGSNATGTRLGHNLLAQIVIRQYSISLDPGQQAARILNAKIGEASASEKNLWLNEEELDEVEKGLSGMRSLTEKEEALMAFSRVKKLEAQRDRKRNQTIRRILVSAIILFGILAAWQWHLADRRYQYSRAGELAFDAKDASKEDNTVAINIARKAYAILKSGSPPEVMQTLSEIFHTQDKIPFYAAKFEHDKMVNTAVFSPDGLNVLTASEDGKVKLWDRNGNLLHIYPHETEVFMAKFSPNGQQILTVTNTLASLWEKDGRLADQDSIPEEKHNVDSFSTDGVKIIPVIMQRDTSAFGLTISNLKTEDNRIIPSPSRNRILALQNGRCSILDKEGRLVKDLPAASVVKAFFSTQGDLFATTSKDADTCIVNIWSEQGDSIFHFNCVGDSVNVVFSPDDKSVLTSANDFVAKEWDFTDPFLHRFPHQTQAINTIDYFSEGNRYLTAGLDSTARVYDQSGRQIDSLKHRGNVISAYFSPDGVKILTASQDSLARIWIPKQSSVKELHHNGEVNSAEFSPDGQLILTASKDSLIRLWTSEGQLLDSIRMLGWVDWAGFSPQGDKLLAFSDDSIAAIWDLSGELLGKMKHPSTIRTACFSPDGLSILTACEDKTLRRWSVTGDSLLAIKLTERARKAVFSPDEKYIIAGGQMVKIWKVNGQLVDSLPHDEPVTEIKVSPDGKLILTANSIGFGRSIANLWDFKGRLLASFEGHTDKITSGIFTPDGNHVLTVSNDGYILRWNTPDAIFNKLRYSKIAPLTRKEEEKYGVHSYQTQEFIQKIKTSVINLLSSKEEPVPNQN